MNSAVRFGGDEALRRGWKVPVDAAPTGKRVLVVGAGPSGLSAAYHLTRLGLCAAECPCGAIEMEPEQT
jgi:NADPH-dependent glutamate synthase beta subunit-like oxidoreductase